MLSILRSISDLQINNNILNLHLLISSPLHRPSFSHVSATSSLQLERHIGRAQIVKSRLLHALQLRVPGHDVAWLSWEVGQQLAFTIGVEPHLDDCIRLLLIRRWYGHLDVLVGDVLHLHASFTLFGIILLQALEEAAGCTLKDEVRLVVESTDMTLSCFENEVVEVFAPVGSLLVSWSCRGRTRSLLLQLA